MKRRMVMFSAGLMMAGSVFAAPMAIAEPASQVQAAQIPEGCTMFPFPYPNGSWGVDAFCSTVPDGATRYFADVTCGDGSIATGPEVGARLHSVATCPFFERRIPTGYLIGKVYGG